MSPDRLLAHFDRISEAPDAVSRLRRFILDLAVRGKLVEQDPKDEPAAELLERIQAEKARFIKEGKLKKSATRSVEDGIDCPFGLPSTWVWGCLSGVAQYGLADKVVSNKDIEADTWVLDLEDIEKGTSKLIERVPSSARPFRSTKTIFKRGDVLFGKLRPYLNKVLVADRDGVCTTEIIPIRGYCQMVPEYVRLVLKSPLTMARVDRLMYGMKMPRLGTEDAVALSFPLPPLAEQHRIVAKVDELMALCDRLEVAQAERENRRDRLAAASLHRLNNGAAAKSFREHARFHLHHLPRQTTRREQIQQLRQTILNLAVRGQLVPQDPNDESALELLKRIQAVKVRLVKEGKISRDRPLPLVAEEDNLGQLPNGWEWVRMQEAFDVRDGTHDTPKYIEDDGVPLITSRNFVDGRISFEDAKLISWDDHNLIKKRSGVDQGDILYSMIGGNIGNQVMVETDREFSIKNVALFKYYSKSDTTPAYLYLFLKTVTIGLQGQAAGGAQPFVSLKQLRSIPFPMPPLAEQHRIVAKVNELMELCDRLEAQLTTTAFARHELLEATIHQAISGQVELQ